MKLYQKKEECCGCGACVNICPTSAIRMVQDKEGFMYPYINRIKCIECGLCRQVCPLKDREEVQCDNKYFGVWSKEEKIRFSSSSGGIFSVLAHYIFGKHGVVYGAGYDTDMKVVHRLAENEEQLEKIKRTKYVQSDMNDTYCKIETKLKNDQWVLF